MTDANLVDAPYAMPDKLVIRNAGGGDLRILADPDAIVGPEDTVYVRAELAVQWIDAITSFATLQSMRDK